MAAFAAALWLLTIQTPPVPKPFPQPGQTTPPATAPAKPATPAPATPQGATPAAPLSAAPSSKPTDASMGVPLYPTAEYLESFDAGRGQRYYLFGSNAAYAEVTGFYRNVLKNGGRTIFEAPAMQQWELAKFQEQTMVYPPSVVVKDYTWGGAEGYLFVDGTKEKRFKTIIQIVPVAAIR